jgi:hypothetical protein|tara:strand:+ start:510 stop:710 length:201 start_codon:yes stop_codon:yes gene_type:complete
MNAFLYFISYFFIHKKEPLKVTHIFEINLAKRCDLFKINRFKATFVVTLLAYMIIHIYKLTPSSNA